MRIISKSQAGKIKVCR